MAHGEVKVKTTRIALTPEQLKLIEERFGKDFAEKLTEITVGEISGRLEIMSNAN
jgi:hypothetical protein